MPQHTNTHYQDTLRTVTHFIQNPANEAHDFNAVAETLYNYQLQHNHPYQHFCKPLALGTHFTWQSVPALTTDTFKLTPAPSCLDSSEITATFMTSGTTGEVRGQHHFRNTELYELSILAAWEQLQLPTIQQLFILTPPPSQAPHSSLSHMMETLRQQYSPTAHYLINNDQLDLNPLLDAAKLGKPVTLLGTALAFLNTFEQLPYALNLPTGSWAVETGGYKGSGRNLSKEELYAQFTEKLGIPADAVWNEYSMTELSSQCYTQGLNRTHRTPHWLKVQVLDPETDLPVAPGEIGYITFHDLANIDSVAALRTQDLGIYHDAHSFTLIGRDPSALPRGCSRSIDEALQR